MAEQDREERASMGPSVVLGLVGAVVVLLLLGAGVWGVGKIVSRIREGREEAEEEETVAEEDGVAEEEDGDGEVNGDGVATEDEGNAEDEGTGEDTGEVEGEGDSEEGVDGGFVAEARKWVANDYKPGDITGSNYTVVWGDTLWEIAEGRYGSGFQWGKIKDANLDKVGFLPDGSRALIIPGDVLDLPE